MISSDFSMISYSDFGNCLNFHLEFQVERSAEEVADFLRQQEEPPGCLRIHQCKCRKSVPKSCCPEIAATRYWSLLIHGKSKYWSILQYLGGWFRELHLSNLSRLESQDDRASFQWQPLMLISFWYDFGDAVCHSNLAMFLGNNLFIDKMHLTLKKCLEAFMACLSYILLESCQEH